MPPSERASARRTYIDWARGIAVLLMIEAHTFDAWTSPLAKRSIPFARAIVLGGFAAPLFLWLAGFAMALGAAQAADRSGSRRTAVERICRRGLELFLLAFLFRLQAFIVSPGSYLVSLFRVDILNIMGPALVAAGLLWAISRSAPVLVATYAAAAATFALLTPIVRTTALVDALPLWFQWYMRPSGDYTAFTAFPWAGFVFAGAACGVVIDAARDASKQPRAQLALGIAGLAILAFGFYTASRPSIYRHSEFWSSSPTWFAIRVGVMTTGMSLIYAVEHAVARWGLRCQPLERLGRHSLFVYWIHVELVYGYLSWPWRGRLPFWGVVGAFGAFATLMYGAIALKERLTRIRPSRPGTAWDSSERQMSSPYGRAT